MVDTRNKTRSTSSRTLNKTPSSTNTFLAALTASEADQLLHPVDTAIKRLQNCQNPVTNFQQFKQVVLNSSQQKQPPSFPEGLTPTSTAFKNMKATQEQLFNPIKRSGAFSLMDGFWSSAANKAASRTTRYVIQDKLQNKVEKGLTSLLPGTINEQTARTLSGGISGVMTGLAEVVAFQPLDTFKTRQQINAKTSASLYAGVGPNACRSALSGGMFFTFYNAALNQSKNKNNPTNTERFAATSFASLLTTCLTNPLDVAKTRIQALPQGSKTSTMQMLKNIISQENPRALAKGLSLKLAQAPIKSVLPFFAFQMLKKVFDTMQTENKNNEQKRLQM